ncbi:MAG: hypothetical protein ACE5HO_09250 [bacterium]
MKKSIYLTCLFTTALLVAGCILGSDDSSTVNARGKIALVQVEGGFFGIVGDDGNNYDPINLDEKFQQEGLRIRFEGRKRKDLNSVHQWGILVEIIEIEKL